jgi:hypothetical protein
MTQEERDLVREELNRIDAKLYSISKSSVAMAGSLLLQGLFARKNELIKSLQTPEEKPEAKPEKVAAHGK